MDHNLAVIITSLFFSALFSGLEIAYISADRLQLELQGRKGSITGKILSGFAKNPSRFIGATLVGNNIALVIYGIFMAILLEPMIVQSLPQYLSSNVVVLVVQTTVSTLLVLVTAEFLPKSIFMINPTRMLHLFAIPMRVILFVLQPVVFLVVKTSKLFITRVLRFEYAEDRPMFGLTDLNNYIKNIIEAKDKGESAEVDTKIFYNALEFKTVLVRECMLPRTEIVAVDVEEDIEELKNAFIESGHSKIVIYNDSIDNVIGYCHSLKLFKKPSTIDEILTPLIIVPETTLANELMIRFISEHKSLALVVDEFGGTSGIVTMEDIIEEIFGEIQDEHDSEELVEQKINDREYLLSARHEIDYLNDRYNWVLPTGEYETLAGMILSVAEDLPQKGDEIRIPPYLLTIQSTHDIRIDLVKLTVTAAE